MGSELRVGITNNQREFISATATEVLFGGAAGGGKSYGEVVDALLYALNCPKSKQLILRRTYPDLARSIIRTVRELYPKELFTYNESSHIGKFVNGSVIDFGYCANEADVYQYQGAEYDTIRFDELTHFTETQYLYLLSRLRGANKFPKQIKSTSNPGGVGHTWVKKRFIDCAPPNTVYETDKKTTRIFIPSKVKDNSFLMASDPDYISRLENLPDKEKRALLYGDWDIFEGQYFSEFRRDVHVIEPFLLPDYWRRYVTLDYGLDCLAVNFIAVDEKRNAYVYKEIHESNLIISDAAEAIKNILMPNEKIYAYLAPLDLWNRRQETGKSVADVFYQHGITLTKTSNDRVAGWLSMKEYLKPYTDEQEILTSKLKIFSSCLSLISDLPLLQHDDKNPSDCAKEPHEITHSCDSLRCFCVYWSLPTPEPKKPEPHYNFDFEKKMKDPLGKGVKISIL